MDLSSDNRYLLSLAEQVNGLADLATGFCCQHDVEDRRSR